ncbi:hypothetical protein UlMin_043012 [Ulmus minor]
MYTLFFVSFHFHFKFWENNVYSCVYWQAHPLYPLFILQNRDEYHNKPMKPMSWWEDCEILGGTWLACSRGGRIALLTNTPKEFAKQLVKEGHRYNGFNLVLVGISAKSMLYVSNRPKNAPIMVQEVSAGIHVLSNAKLDSHWHKCLELSFKEELGKYSNRKLPAKEMIEKLMRDRGQYGTKSSAALSVRVNGEVDFYETYLDDSST